MNIACIIVGIDGWERYTLPLIESIEEHEPECAITVVDNASKPPYPPIQMKARRRETIYTTRSCYSAAINYGAESALQYYPDWYIVLSNDVLCTGPFVALLEATPDDRIIGPHMAHNQGYEYLEGWCVAIPRKVWDSVGGWDENFRLSSWEDVDYSYMVRDEGFQVEHRPDLPFVHMEQMQRHAMVDFWGADVHNSNYFREKRERVRLQKRWRRAPEKAYRA